jgi:hypothetical protein
MAWLIILPILAALFSLASVATIAVVFSGMRILARKVLYTNERRFAGYMVALCIGAAIGLAYGLIQIAEGRGGSVEVTLVIIYITVQALVGLATAFLANPPAR